MLLGGTLTLLELIIGFTFSMVVGRYDQRRRNEEEEANAIGTAYVRADLVPALDAENGAHVADELSRSTHRQLQNTRQATASADRSRNRSSAKTQFGPLSPRPFDNRRR